VGSTQIPFWPEFGVEHMWARVHDQPDIMAYIPDEWTAETAQRSFFLGIVCKVRPLYADELIVDYGRQRRDRAIAKKLKPPVDMDIDPEWAGALL
jgi:hypothetical protein